MMTNGDREGWTFLSHPRTINAFFLAHHLIPHFIFPKRFSEVPLYMLQRDIIMKSLKHNNKVLLFDFYLSHGLVRGM